MKGILIQFVILSVFLNCNPKQKEDIDYNDKQPVLAKVDSVLKIEPKKTGQVKSEIIQAIEFNMDSLIQNSFHFKEYQPYALSDTIRIDLNGNGVEENIYFENKTCSKIILSEKGQNPIYIGCDNLEVLEYPENVEWVNQWCVVLDKEVWEVLFTENGDIDKDTIVNLERPSIYIGKREVGGGIITYKNEKLYWVHQSD